MTHEDIYDRLAPLYELLSRLPYEPDFVLVGKPYGAAGPMLIEQALPSYFAGFRYGLRPYFTLLFLVLM